MHSHVSMHACACICVCMCIQTYIHDKKYKWRSQDNYMEFTVFFHHMVPGVYLKPTG